MEVKLQAWAGSLRIIYILLNDMKEFKINAWKIKEVYFKGSSATNITNKCMTSTLSFYSK
jgi:hypothetical protein